MPTGNLRHLHGSLRLEHNVSCGVPTFSVFSVFLHPEKKDSTDVTNWAQASTVPNSSTSQMTCDRHLKDGSIQEERKDPPSNKLLSWESVTSTCCNISQVEKTLHPIYVGLDFDSPTTPSMTWRTTYYVVKTLGHLWCHHSPPTARCTTLHFLQVCLSRCCRSCIF